MRHTRSHTKNRRSHHALKAPVLAVCKHCGATHRPHHMCLECGYYNGRQVMDLEAKKVARQARLQTRREAISAQKAEMSAPTTPEVIAETSEEKKEEDKQS